MKDVDAMLGLNEPKEEAAVADDRDQRTVFVLNLALRATERQVREFFEQAGAVRDVRLITDRQTGRNKGFGYIEFDKIETVEQALLLSGSPLLGQPVSVQVTQNEKNKAAATATPVGSTKTVGIFQQLPTRVFVGGLDYDVAEGDVRNVFDEFGPIEYVTMHKEPDGSKAYAFIQFKRGEDAKKALRSAGDVMVKGRTVKVGYVTESAAKKEEREKLGKKDGLDEDEQGPLNAHGRLMLMAKLRQARESTSGGGKSAPSPPRAASPPAPTGGESTCILLRNMFDPAKETDPNFDQEIANDVRDECRKHGNVRHLYVDKNSLGNVYVRFDSPTGAGGALRALHGRYFAGTPIAAEFLTEDNYSRLFPAS
jgi:RNA-binding protein 39